MTAPAAYGQTTEPAAPRGPGVVPPFASPPTDRDDKRLWIGLGIGALMIALCCVGGIAGVGIVLAGSAQQVEAQAKRTAGDYLGALKRGAYTAAYEMLCTRITDERSRQVFTREARRDPVTDYTVEDATIEETAVVVTATVEYSGEDFKSRKYQIETEFGRMVICGER